MTLRCQHRSMVVTTWQRRYTHVVLTGYMCFIVMHLFSYMSLALFSKILNHVLFKRCFLLFSYSQSCLFFFIMLPEEFRGAHIVAASSVRPYIRPSRCCPSRFSVTTCWISTKLYKNLKYRFKMRISIEARKGHFLSDIYQTRN